MKADEVKRFKPVINDKPYKPYAHCEESEDGIYVRLADYDELKAQRDALAAEMSVVHAIHDKCVFITDDDYDACPKNVQEIIRSLAVMKIAATDAYLNSVRAEGVEMLATLHGDIADFADGDNQQSHRITQIRAKHFAAQLRAGEPS